MHSHYGCYTSSELDRRQDIDLIVLQTDILNPKIQICFMVCDNVHKRLGNHLLLRGYNHSWATAGLISWQLLLFAGDPVSAAWTGKGRFRFDITKLGVAQAGTSIALDIVVLVFPIPVLWGLHMKTRRKIAIALIFWLGAL